MMKNENNIQDELARLDVQTLSSRYFPTQVPISMLKTNGIGMGHMGRFLNPILINVLSSILVSLKYVPLCITRVCVATWRL